LSLSIQQTSLGDLAAGWGAVWVVAFAAYFVIEDGRPRSLRDWIKLLIDAGGAGIPVGLIVATLIWLIIRLKYGF
jgi:Mn2+/Fe2+ NRAMP family transporter